MCYYRQDTIFKVGTSWYKIKGLKLILVMNTKRLINIFACSLIGIKIKFSFGVTILNVSFIILIAVHPFPSPCESSNESCSTNRIKLQKLLRLDK